MVGGLHGLNQSGALRFLCRHCFFQYRNAGFLLRLCHVKTCACSSDSGNIHPIKEKKGNYKIHFEKKCDIHLEQMQAACQPVSIRKAK